jgi:hypothetical protein
VAHCPDRSVESGLVPLRGDSYTINVSDGSAIPVSNFVTPAYFTDNPLAQPLDHLGTFIKPSISQKAATRSA